MPSPEKVAESRGHAKKSIRRNQSANPNDNVLLTLPAATKVAEQIIGVRPHRSTLWRYATKGHRGIHLRTRKILGGYRTTREWLQEFFDQTENAAA
jgi:hypothetical protein